MTDLPEPPAAPVAGQAANPLTDSVIQAAIRDVIQQTSYRDDRPLPAYGPTPPVPQPGAPAMSQTATDIGRAAMYCGLATVPPGLVATAILLASQQADPVVIGMICAAPAALAVPILAIARLLRGARPEPEVHQHFHGDVTQTTVNAKNTGVWAKNINGR